MEAGFCVKYWEIAKGQMRLSLRANLLAAAAVLVCTPVIFSIQNLDALASSLVLERFVALIGIVLLTPLFLPEQDRSIAEVVESKCTRPAGVHLVRLLLAAASLFLLVGGFIAVMAAMSCVFDRWRFIAGTFATAFFLGALGFAAYAVTDTVVAGYLLPLGYYMFNMFNGREHLGWFYLFSLGRNSFAEKFWLMGFGLGLVVAGLLYRWIRIVRR